jgi:alginate O-acetyltransferase complex protein AlgI
MTFQSLPLFALALISVGVFWTLTERYRQDGVAAFTALALLLFAPATAAVMLASIVAVQQAMAWADRSGRKTAATAVTIVMLTAVFFVSRELERVFAVQWLMLGIAYSTMRHIHVLAEWRLGRIATPSLRDYCHYHLLLPVLMAGPIHRLPHFQRQCERRRWSAKEFFSGAERALLGFALVIVVGEYLIRGKIGTLLGPEEGRGLFKLWLASAIDWLYIYATFAGLTGIALGFCLMMGLRLEENFNRPWLARDLVQFWTRWHMTLSHWCRDYVYQPVAMWLKSPLIGIFCAMLVLGLWHGTSWYYVLWGPYQAIGIALSHGYARSNDPLRLGRLPEAVKAVLAPLAILAWVSSARPVIAAIIGVSP